MKKLLFRDGISTTPSDYASDDLSLSCATNVINDGEIRTYPPAKTLFSLPEGTEILTIHSVYGTTYYICIQEGHIKMFTHTGTSIEYLNVDIDASSFGDYHSSSIIGNTVSLLFSSGIHYILYTEGSYKYLGTTPPRIDITFDLKGRLTRSTEFEIEQMVEPIEDYTTIPKDEQKAITETILAQANKFIAQKATEKGRFVFPFFVRYAYRLYDGTHIMHSAPILMLPSTYQGIKALIYSQPIDTALNPGYIYNNPKARIVSFVNELIVKNLSVDYSQLSKWKDIVDGVDIFVSAPIYNYDQNGTVETITSFSSLTSVENTSELDYGVYEPYASQLHSGKHYFYDAYIEARTFGAFPNDDAPAEEENLPETGDDYVPQHMYLLPRKSTKAIFDDIKSNSLFYKVISLRNKDNRLQGDFKINGDVLSTLQLQPTLADDYNSNDHIIAKYGYAYNSRLNIADITRELFTGYKAEDMSVYTRPFGSRPTYDIYTYINDVSGEKIVKSSSRLSVARLGELLYYPNTRAYKMVIIQADENPSPTDVTLFDVDAYLMISEDKDTGEKSWAITINTYPDILSETGITISGYIDLASGSGGGAYEVSVPSLSNSNQISLDLPYTEGAEVKYASFSIEATDSSYKPYKVFFDYIAGTHTYTNEYSSSTPHPSKKWIELSLEEHPSLNGAYHFSMFKDYKWNTDNIPNITPTDNASIHLHNKIYTSEVDNPFNFPASGISTIGDGDIIGLSSATQALSQGQFGEFPLYAFTSSGIWALYLNEKGTYSAKQPISRDVCSSASSITQTDTGVIFVSAQGLMYLRGSNTSSISEQLSYPSFDISKLPYINEFTHITGSPSIQEGGVSFSTYLSKADIAYDYINSHIIVFNRDYPYSYIYSLSNKTWTCAELSIKQSLNSYPDVKLVSTTGEVITPGNKHDSTTYRKGLIITRPFSLSRDTYKTISQLYIRGQIPASAHNHIKCALYGSRDGDNYCLINTGGDYIRQSHGSGYRYFVLCIALNIPPSHTVSCVDIDYRDKQNNRLR